MRKRFEEIVDILTKDFAFISLLSDAKYNQHRYAYNTTIVIFEFDDILSPNNISMLAKEIKNDQHIIINDKILVIGYRFIDFINVDLTINKIIKKFSNNILFRYIFISIQEYSDFNINEIIKLLTYDLVCKQDG